MSRYRDPREEADEEIQDVAPRTRQRRAAQHSHIRWSEYAEGEQPSTGLVTTYRPAVYEEVWLRGSLRPFFSEHFISDVLAQIKGGKEATVYRCAADPRLGTQWLAAKVYRPRMFRNLRNDKMYRQGRPVLTSEGRPVKKTDQRLARALGKKTAFGTQVEHTSWLMYEFTTMQRLHEAGAAVPQPVASAENAILMSYIGDGDRAAPALQGVALARAEAAHLFEEVLRNIELMLQHGLIHGDLSAYNILYWEGVVTIIDFPQVTFCHENPQAHFILQRDIARVCEYFAAYGVASDPDWILRDLWSAYVLGRETEEDENEIEEA
jgi:RIO kinase 1